MAFDTLGVNVVASGIRGVASDIAKLAGSFMKYVGAVKQADAASVKAAQSQSKLADTMVNKTQKNIKSLERQYDRLVTRANTLRVTIDSLNMTMRNPVSTKANYDKAIRDVQAYTDAIKRLESAMRYTRQGQVYKRDQWIVQAVADLKVRLADANVELQKHAKNYAASIKEQDRLTKAVQAFINVTGDMKSTADDIAKAYQDMADAANESADKHRDLTEAQNKLATGMFETENVLDAIIGMLNDSSGAFSGITGVVSKLVPELSSLAGGMGQTGGASTALAGTLGISTGALAGIVTGIGVAVVAVGAAVHAFKALKAAVNLAIKVVQVAWQVFKKLASVVWDVATAIGKVLWNALKKIVGAPFKLISNLFDGIFGSMKRVFEMAIGMNLSRIWWQLGMKIRDMFKTASDAAMEYQVTYTRLSTLIKNEVIGKLGPSPSVDEYNNGLKQATVMTEELVNWTSKLAVTTIFGAEDILNVYTLAMSYGFASTQAEKLTESVLDFASGMGLGDTEMKRIIENFGQMRAQGKITGTELRDLARGSFVPVNDILEQMAENVGLIGDYDIPNMQAINDVLKNMADNGEITNDTFETMSGLLGKLGADGKITRQEFDGLVSDLSKSDIMQKFGLSAEQAGKALEGIKTGKLTEELNQLIKTGKITIDEFFEAFIEMVEDKYPNAAKSMGLTMKAVKSNIEDYIATMIGWRLIAPVFEVVAKHVQNFIQNTLMDESQIIMFDKMGKAFKVVAELVMTYSEAMRKANDIFGKLTQGPFSQIKLVFQELFDVIGVLGTPEFSQRMVLNFTSLLRGFGMAVDKSNIVFGGITRLNDIMSDIMNGVEINPEALGKALKDTFGTLWTDFFGPTIKNGLELAWSKHIAPAIGRLWQKMKDKFSEWKTDTLLPGIKTFFTETLPGWISGVSDWLIENGPGIITSIGTFVSDILGELQKTSEFYFGPDHPLSLLLQVLKDLAIWGTTKIADPTADINQENLDKVAESFTKLKDALLAIAEEKLLDIPAVKKFVDTWNSPGAQSIIDSYAYLFQTLQDVASINFDSITTLFGAISSAFGGGSGDVTTIKVTKITEFIDKMTALSGMLMSAPAVAIDSFLLLIDGIVNFATSLAQVDWNSQPLVDSISELIVLFAEKEIKSAAVENFVEMADKIAGFVEKIMGIDATAVRTKLRDIYNGIREFFGLKPIDFPPITGTVPVELTPDPKSTDPNWQLNDDGSFTYIGKPISGKYPNGKVTFEPEVEVVPVTDPTDTSWIDDWLDNNLYGPQPVGGGGGKPLKSIIVDVEITPKADATTAGSTMATDFSSGFSATVATEMAAIEIQIPEIDITGAQNASESAAAIVADIAAVFSSDTSVASAGSAMMNSLTMTITDTATTAQQATANIISAIAAVFSSDTTVASAGSTMMSNFMTAINNSSTDAREAAANIASSLSGPLNGLAGTFTSAGANAVQGLWNGMASVMGSLIVWWIGQVAYLNSIVPRMSHITSPSKLYHKYGENMMKGLQLGLESGQEGAVAQMHDAAIELRQALGAIGTGTISPQQYNNVSNTTNWNVNVTTPLVASTPIQAYEILRMRAR